QAIQEGCESHCCQPLGHDSPQGKSVGTGCSDYEVERTDSRLDQLPPVRMCELCVRSSGLRPVRTAVAVGQETAPKEERSEEHTSELQSRFELVCRLLREKTEMTPGRAAPQR